MAAGWLIARLIGWSMTQVHQWLFSSWRRMLRSHVSALLPPQDVFMYIYIRARVSMIYVYIRKHVLGVTREATSPTSLESSLCWYSVGSLCFSLALFLVKRIFFYKFMISSDLYKCFRQIRYYKKYCTFSLIIIISFSQHITYIVYGKYKYLCLILKLF